MGVLREDRLGAEPHLFTIDLQLMIIVPKDD